MEDRSESVELTNMCMIQNGTKILVEDRKNKTWAGVTFPGGHIEPGESFNHAMIREIFEETGLKIKHPLLCGIKQFPRKDNKRYIVLLYKANDFEGQIKSSKEGEIFWIERTDLRNYSLPENFAEMLQILRIISYPKSIIIPLVPIIQGEWITETY